jgi:hypothetical protein
MKFPWEQLPATVEVTPAAVLETTVAAMQRDMAYMVRFTAVRVHSNRPELCLTVNTVRGQIVPRGVCTFADGTTTEFQDIGMPQPGCETLECITDLVALTLDTAKQLGLSL